MARPSGTVNVFGVHMGLQEVERLSVGLKRDIILTGQSESSHVEERNLLNLLTFIIVFILKGINIKTIFWQQFKKTYEKSHVKSYYICHMTLCHSDSKCVTPSTMMPCHNRLWLVPGHCIARRWCPAGQRIGVHWLSLHTHRSWRMNVGLSQYTLWWSHNGQIMFSQYTVQTVKL